MKGETKMLKKITASVLAGIIILTAFAGCSGQGDIASGATKNEFPVTVSGVTIQKAPTGVVVLSPNIADVILKLGYEIVLKGKSADCTQSDLSVLPNVIATDVDAIKKLGADFVLVDSKMETKTADAFKKAGIPVVVIAPATSRTDLDRLYSAVGSVIKGGNTGYTYGKKISQDTFLTIDDITRSIPDSNTPITACYLYDVTGKGATNDTLAGNLLECAGLTNGAGNCTNGKLDIETLLLGDPKYIFCPTGLKDKLKVTEKYKELTAVRENRVIEMDPSYMQWQGSSLTQAVFTMASTAYPQLAQNSSSTSSSSAATSSAAPSSSTASVASKPSSTSSTASQAATSSAAASSTAPANGTLKKGDKGATVLKMQQRLDALGYLYTKATGEYTDTTAQQVKDFQYLNGLTVTGIADAKTLAKLYSSDAKKRTN